MSIQRLATTSCTTFLATLLGLGLVPCVDAFAKSNTSQSGDTISLSGSDWRIHEDVDGNGAERRLFAADASSSEWIAATVPGNIQADLEAARLLRPLWYGLGDDIRLGKAAEKDWWYRKDFTAPAGWTGKRVQLVFDGVDHECEIFLNSQRVGGFAGMFRKMAYDVSGQLRPGQVNHLAVRIARSPASLVPHVGKPTIIKLYRHVLGDVKSPTEFRPRLGHRHLYTRHLEGCCIWKRHARRTTRSRCRRGFPTAGGKPP